MAKVSNYERLQIDSLLQAGTDREIEVGSALAVFDVSNGAGRETFEVAVLPAMRETGLNQSAVHAVFDDESPLARIAEHVKSAEVIVVELTDLNPCAIYVLGLCHALGRCPLLLAAADEPLLPFNFEALRCVRYHRSREGMIRLRQDLCRALRVFLAATRAPGPSQ